MNLKQYTSQKLFSKKSLKMTNRFTVFHPHDNKGNWTTPIIKNPAVFFQGVWYLSLMTCHFPSSSFLSQSFHMPNTLLQLQLTRLHSTLGRPKAKTRWENKTRENVFKKVATWSRSHQNRENPCLKKKVGKNPGALLISEPRIVITPWKMVQTLHQALLHGPHRANLKAFYKESFKFQWSSLIQYNTIKYNTVLYHFKQTILILQYELMSFCFNMTYVYWIYKQTCYVPAQMSETLPPFHLPPPTPASRSACASARAQTWLNQASALASSRAAKLVDSSAYQCCIRCCLGHQVGYNIRLFPKFQRSKGIFLKEVPSLILVLHFKVDGICFALHLGRVQSTTDFPQEFSCQNPHVLSPASSDSSLQMGAIFWSQALSASWSSAWSSSRLISL